MAFNIEAEQAVIGTILMEGSLFDSLIVNEEHFHDQNLKRIYQAMKSVYQKEQDINVVTVVSALGEDINLVGGVSYLTELAGSVPSVESLRNYEYLVLEAYRKRKSRNLALKYSENPNDESLESLIKNLESLKEIGATTEEKTTYELLQEIAAEMVSPSNRQSGYLTGFKDLDDITGGFQPTDLIIIAARPSVGKTAFALNIGAGHCKNGGTTHIFSLEMGATQLLQRMISAEANVNGQKWKTMSFSAEDYNKAINAIGELSNWNLHIHEKATTINEIKAKIRKAVSKQPEEKHLVIIDYLQLIRTTGRYERRDLEVGAMTRELKLLAKELEIPIILLSQLSRNVEQRQDKRPMLSDLRESGNIEQDADVVGFLYRDDYYDKESEKQNVIEIILAKQRNGPTGTVELAFLKEYGKFVNLAKWYEGAEAYAQA